MEEKNIVVGVTPLGSFSWVLMRLKEGAKVQRKGWMAKSSILNLQQQSAM